MFFLKKANSLCGKSLIYCLWTFIIKRGNNEQGQLGLGDLKDRDIPQQVYLEPKNQYSSCPHTTIVDMSLVTTETLKV